MLKKMLLAGCCLAIVSGTALSAQAATGEDGAGLTKIAAAGNPPPPPPPPGGPRGPGGPGGPGMPGGPDGPGGPGGPGPHGPPPPPPSKAAHFRLERGPTRIDVKCADDDTTAACADVTLKLMDKLMSIELPNPPMPPAPPPGVPAPGEAPAQ